MKVYSSNHSKITRDFAEHMVLYWLSKNGYECALVQHIGIDIIASNGEKRMGISVKSRSRKEDQINHKLTITRPDKHIDHVIRVCNFFAFEPFFAFLLDQNGSIDCCIIPLKIVVERYGIKKISTQDWNTKVFHTHPKAMLFKLEWA